MHTNRVTLNPFALMMEPELVLQAMEQSESLRQLRQRVCHPLDKPLRSMHFNVSADLAAFDAAVEDGYEPPLYQSEEDTSFAPRFI